MIEAPELTIDDLAKLVDDEGRVHIPVTVSQDFMSKWYAANDEELIGRDPSWTEALIEELFEAIFVSGDFPETAYESLEEIDEGDNSYEIACDFSFAIDY